MNITDLTVVATAPEGAQARFRRLRRDTNLAFLAWLHEHPDPRDVAIELAGSTAVLRQLAALAKDDVA